jgi:ribose transport system substrate-binding protein
VKASLVSCLWLIRQGIGGISRSLRVATMHRTEPSILGRSTASSVTALFAVVVVLAAACGNAESTGAAPRESAASPATSTDASDNDCAGRSLNRTEPPEPLREIDWTHEVGEPTWYTEVDLTSEQIEELCQQKLTAAFLNVISGAAVEPYRDGIAAALDDVGMELVTEAYAEFDPAKQASDVETAMALNPDVVLGLPVDPVSGAEAFRPVVDSGTCLVLGGVEPEGYEVGQDYFAQVTFDLPGLGDVIGEAIADSAGGAGKIGYIVHDADFFITNTRDQAALAYLKENYPNIEIVQEPMANPANAEEIASAMITRNPDLGVVFAPWSAGPADGVLAALRSLGREDIKVVTSDLDAPTSLSMAQGGPISAVSTSLTYEFGYTWAVAGMQCLLDLPTPTVVILPATVATAENLDEIWPLVYGPKIPLPEDVRAAMEDK